MFASLKKAGINVDIKKDQRENDISLVMKVMRTAVANHLDTLVLIVGDSHYADLIEYLT